MSEFGTGKTSLLKAKAEKLLRQKQQIVIISFEDRESTQESILTLQYKIDFGDEIVHSLKGTGEKLCVLNNNLVFNPKILKSKLKNFKPDNRLWVQNLNTVYKLKVKLFYD